MTCRACGYDDSPDARSLVHGQGMSGKFIELEPILIKMPPEYRYSVDVKTGQTSSGMTSGRPRTSSGLPYGTRAAFACPACGMVRVEVGS